MKRHVSADAARENLNALLESVSARGDEIVLERSGKPVAVIIPPHMYERLERQKSEMLQTLEKIWANRPPIEDPEEGMSLLTPARFLANLRQQPVPPAGEGTLETE